MFATGSALGPLRNIGRLCGGNRCRNVRPATIGLRLGLRAILLPVSVACTKRWPLPARKPVQEFGQQDRTLLAAVLPGRLRAALRSSRGAVLLPSFRRCQAEPAPWPRTFVRLSPSAGKRVRFLKETEVNVSGGRKG